jgi:hypothetical protein
LSRRTWTSVFGSTTGRRRGSADRVVATARVSGSWACSHGWSRGGADGAKNREQSRSTRRDKSRDLPGMRGSSVIFVNVHVIDSRTDTFSGNIDLASCSPPPAAH